MHPECTTTIPASMTGGPCPTTVAALGVGGLAGSQQTRSFLKIAAQRTGETLDGAWLVGDNADTAVAAAAAAGIKGRECCQ